MQILKSISGELDHTHGSVRSNTSRYSHVGMKLQSLTVSIWPIDTLGSNSA